METGGSRMTDAMHPYKVGDQVLIYSAGWAPTSEAKLATVSKVSKTQITADGVRFVVDRAGWGWEYGIQKSAWFYKSCHRATPERLVDYLKLAEAKKAVGACRSAAELLRNAEGDAAIYLASILPTELKVTK